MVKESPRLVRSDLSFNFPTNNQQNASVLDGGERYVPRRQSTQIFKDKDIRSVSIDECITSRFLWKINSLKKLNIPWNYMMIQFLHIWQS